MSVYGARAITLMLATYRRIDKRDLKAGEDVMTNEGFVKCTDFEFECTKIVGRKFKNIDDHAGYLRDEGCSKIIEVLAAK